MAGIEKVCEFSGENPGWKMYGYKRNHVQIMPEYRKLFRGANAVLVIDSVELCYKFKNGCYTTIGSIDHLNYNEWYGTNYSRKEYLKKYRYLNRFGPGKIKPEYTFTLKVTNPELQGQVEGEYKNWTFDLPATIKRLKRMLRCRELKVLNNTKIGEF